MISASKQRIKKVFDRTLEQVRKGENPNVSGNMRLEGYSTTSAHALKVTETKTWAELLARIDDTIVVARIMEALISPDHRSALGAADMILKLKDYYPAGKLKIQAYNEEIEKLRLKDAHQQEEVG